MPPLDVVAVVDVVDVVALVAVVDVVDVVDVVPVSVSLLQPSANAHTLAPAKINLLNVLVIMCLASRGTYHSRSRRGDRLQGASS